MVKYIDGEIHSSGQLYSKSFGSLVDQCCMDAESEFPGYSLLNDVFKFPRFHKHSIDEIHSSGQRYENSLDSLVDQCCIDLCVNYKIDSLLTFLNFQDSVNTWKG